MKNIILFLALSILGGNGTAQARKASEFRL